MSLPEILRNPRIQHLQASGRTSANGLVAPNSRKSDPHIGKRRQRRKENSRFLSNPHAVRPSPADYQIPANTVRSTFAVKHSTLDHNKALEELAQTSYSLAPDFASPKHNSAAFEVDSAIQGQFSISLRDAHHFLRARLDDQYQGQHVASAILDTPPVTDYELSDSVDDTDLSDFVSGSEL
ncbi:hypothetical protein MVES1_003006 [Malassezia vespertilionis]|uniref:uncharacterized protein n=1 Tax=Malassezia vespertilionis TaxID=2020962 RepID=UPI0024B1C4A0|nr:uncharacterized protein MVES1_003006 [Malassezia vespertilionis]WFD07637.1 hypothetical protein MVES1_003006 [Malassezia vespertilionis]